MILRALPVIEHLGEVYAVCVDVGIALQGVIVHGICTFPRELRRIIVGRIAQCKGAVAVLLKWVQKERRVKRLSFCRMAAALIRGR